MHIPNTANFVHSKYEIELQQMLYNLKAVLDCLLQDRALQESRKEIVYMDI